MTLSRCSRSSRKRPMAISRATSLFVAAITRTSTGTDFAEPTREITPSCRARSTLACAERLMSPTSSRNSVPPSASSNLPGRSATAPVKLPFMWPNSSLSINSPGIAGQLTSTNGPAAGDGGGVDLDKRPRGARAERVDGARDELLAGAVLSRDEHACRRRPHFFDQGDEAANRLTRADDLVMRPDFLLEADVLVDQHDVLQRVPQREQDAVGVERLLEKVVRAELRRFHGGLDRAVPGDHHDLRLAVQRPDALQRLETVHPFHFDVEKHEMRLELGVDAHGLLPRRTHLHFDFLVLENLLQRFANAFLVVDDQHAPLGHGDRRRL